VVPVPERFPSGSEPTSRPTGRTGELEPGTECPEPGNQTQVPMTLKVWRNHGTLRFRRFLEPVLNRIVLGPNRREGSWYLYLYYTIYVDHTKVVGYQRGFVSVGTRLNSHSRVFSIKRASIHPADDALPFACFQLSQGAWGTPPVLFYLPPHWVVIHDIKVSANRDAAR